MFNPIAANVQTIKNLLSAFVPDITVAGIGKILAMQDMITKPIINQGNIFLMLKFALMDLSFGLVACASLRFGLSWINAKVMTVGIMASVLVSFTIVAKSPAPYEKAYPYFDSIKIHEKDVCSSFYKKEEVRITVGATKTNGEFVIVPEVRRFLMTPNCNLDLYVDNTETLLHMLEQSKQ